MSAKRLRRLFFGMMMAIILACAGLPAVTVTSPNGGERWAIGSTVTITWTPTAAGSSMRITLYRGGTLEANRVGTIVEGTRGVVGSYSWTAGVMTDGVAAAGGDYYLRLKLVGEDEQDFSDAAFSLLGTIAVTSPMETAAYEASRAAMSVAWAATDVSGDVRVDLERQDGPERYVIADAVPVGGSPLSWPIPLATAEGTYRVKVSQGVLAGVSGRCFIMAYRPPYVEVLQPNGGEDIPMGGSYPVRWTPHYVEGDLRIELLKDGRLVGVLSERTPAGGMCTFYWDARTCGGRELLSGRGFKVRVTSLDGLYTDDSDGPFTLSPRPSITLFAPNSGETWVSGTVEDIRWNWMKLEGYTVEIDLHYPDPSRPTGTGGFQIARGVTATDGKFSWTVGTVRNAGPVYFRPGVQKGCTIFVRAVKGGSVLTSESRAFKIRTP